MIVISHGLLFTYLEYVCTVFEFLAYSALVDHSEHCLLVQSSGEMGICDILFLVHWNKIKNEFRR